MDHAQFPGMAESHDRWYCFDFNTKLKKKFKNCPPGAKRSGAPAVSSNGKHIIISWQEISFLMTDTSVGLAWTVTHHSANQACEETGR